jgi:hypothetical protein
MKKEESGMVKGELVMIKQELGMQKAEVVVEFQIGFV